ncbi:MAG: universal stress protein [Saprospiraceae bacterium]|nr:universal stress protein [Lewinella sp.]
MKYILVPTDFSPTAKTAYHFAVEMARYKRLPIKLIHCYIPETDPAFPYMAVNTQEFLDARQELITRFRQHTPAPHDGGMIVPVEVSTEIKAGYPTEEIVRMSEDPDMDMIVMGTTGEHGLAGQLFGSVSTHISRKAYCPVLLVPKGVTFNGLKNILFASSSEAVHDGVLQRLKDLAILFGSSVHFVHVRETNDKTDYQDVEEHIFDFFFGESEPVFAFNMDMISADDAVEGLNKYVKLKNIDLTVMVSPRRSFWEGILHRSKTKAMVLNTDIPMLVFHANEE